MDTDYKPIARLSLGRPVVDPRCGSDAVERPSRCTAGFPIHWQVATRFNVYVALSRAFAFARLQVLFEI